MRCDDHRDAWFTWRHTKRKHTALVEVNFVVYWTHGTDFKVSAFYVLVSEPQWARLRRPGCWRWKRLRWTPSRTRLWRCMVLRVKSCRTAQVLAFWTRVSCSTTVKGLSCGATPVATGRSELLWPVGSGSTTLERHENGRSTVSIPWIYFPSLICDKHFLSPDHMWGFWVCRHVQVKRRAGLFHGGQLWTLVLCSLCWNRMFSQHIKKKWGLLIKTLIKQQVGVFFLFSVLIPNAKTFLTHFQWLTLMTDHLPLLRCRFSGFEVIWALLLSPKKQTSDGSEHPQVLFVFSSPFCLAAESDCKKTRETLSYRVIYMFVFLNKV